jgi:hypothetical protein
MQNETQAQMDAERMLPLLRSIGQELLDRTRAIEALEAKLEARAPARQVPDQDGAQLEAELALHRRELRSVERELSRLGCSLDADHPLRILVLGRPGKLDDTHFYRATSDTSAS